MQKLIYIANDHNGYELKNFIVKASDLRDLNFKDLGCGDGVKVDYPDYAKMVAESIKSDENARGILICGSAIGMSIASNRFKHVRAALCLSEEYAILAREHNDANILILSAKFVSKEDNINIIKKFLFTEFLGSYHINRVKKLGNLG